MDWRWAARVFGDETRWQGGWAPGMDGKRREIGGGDGRQRWAEALVMAKGLVPDIGMQRTSFEVTLAPGSRAQRHGALGRFFVGGMGERSGKGSWVQGSWECSACTPEHPRKSPASRPI